MIHMIVRECESGTDKVDSDGLTARDIARVKSDEANVVRRE